MHMEKTLLLRGIYNIGLNIGDLENRKWHIKYIVGWFNPLSTTIYAIH